jgi:hypothetical protein
LMAEAPQGMQNNWTNLSGHKLDIWQGPSGWLTVGCNALLKKSGKNHLVIHWPWVGPTFQWILRLGTQNYRYTLGLTAFRNRTADHPKSLANLGGWIFCKGYKCQGLVMVRLSKAQLLHSKGGALSKTATFVTWIASTTNPCRAFG